MPLVLHWTFRNANQSFSVKHMQKQREYSRDTQWPMYWVVIGILLFAPGCSQKGYYAAYHFQGSAVNLMPDTPERSRLEVSYQSGHLSGNDQYYWTINTNYPPVHLIFFFPDKPEAATTAHLVGPGGVKAYLYRWELDESLDTVATIQVFHKYTAKQRSSNPAIIPLRGRLNYQQSEDETVTIGLDLTGDTGMSDDPHVTIVGDIIQTQVEYKKRTDWPFPLSFIQWWIEMSKWKD